MKRNWIGCLLVVVLFTACSTQNKSVEYLGAIAKKRAEVSTSGEMVLENGERIVTPRRFKPPVEITIVAKTDSTNLRLAYAADEVIFNWERDPRQLRIDGGPADGNHKHGAGFIPANQFVTIRWLVTPNKQKIYVDEQLRFEHAGDYSQIDNPVSVFPAEHSRVTVKSIKVRQLGSNQSASQ